jgi:hypothetical protein
MNIMDIDWPYIGATFLVVVVIMLVPLAMLAGAKFDEHFGEKLDAYLLEKLKRFDERKARKIR